MYFVLLLVLSSFALSKNVLSKSQILEKRDVNNDTPFYLQVSLSNGTSLTPIHTINSFNETLFAEVYAGSNALVPGQSLYIYTFDGYISQNMYFAEVILGFSAADPNPRDIFPAPLGSFNKVLFQLGNIGIGGVNITVPGNFQILNATGVLYDFTYAYIRTVPANLTILPNGNYGCSFEITNPFNLATSNIACTFYFNATAYFTTSPQLTSGRITTGRITSGRITTGRITSGRITSGLITSSYVTTSLITSGLVTTQQLTSQSVTTQAITSLYVTSGKEANSGDSEAQLQITPTTVAAATGGVGAVVIGILIAVIICIIRKKKMEEEETNIEMTSNQKPPTSTGTVYDKFA